MPITKSAKKALRQSERKRAQNLKRKKAASEVIRDIKKLVQAGKADEAMKLLPKAFKALDKAVKRKILHKNTAGRRKSKLSKLAQGPGKSK